MPLTVVPVGIEPSVLTGPVGVAGMVGVVVTSAVAEEPGVGVELGVVFGVPVQAMKMIVAISAAKATPKTTAKGRQLEFERRRGARGIGEA